MTPANPSAPRPPTIEAAGPPNIHQAFAFVEGRHPVRVLADGTEVPWRIDDLLLLGNYDSLLEPADRQTIEDYRTLCEKIKNKISRGVAASLFTNIP